MVGIAPAQEQSSQTDMQEGQWEQRQKAPVPIPCLCYLPPLGQGLLQVHDLGLAAAELQLQLFTCLWEGDHQEPVWVYQSGKGGVESKPVNGTTTKCILKLYLEVLLITQYRPIYTIVNSWRSSTNPGLPFGIQRASSLLLQEGVGPLKGLVLSGELTETKLWLLPGNTL